MFRVKNHIHFWGFAASQGPDLSPVALRQLVGGSESLRNGRDDGVGFIKLIPLKSTSVRLDDIGRIRIRNEESPAKSLKNLVTPTGIEPVFQP